PRPCEPATREAPGRRLGPRPRAHEPRCRPAAGTHVGRQQIGAVTMTRQGDPAMKPKPGRARLVAALVVFGLSLLLSGPASASPILVPISGAGSTWVSNALDQWIRNIAQYGVQVNYAATGSSDG